MLQFVNQRELSCPDLNKEIILQATFYKAQMDLDMTVRYNFMMETDPGVLLAQASMTLYENEKVLWLSSPEHHMECQWIHPERHHFQVASGEIAAAGPTYHEYAVKREVANRVAADVGASELASDAFSSATPAHLLVCEKYWSAQDSTWKKHWGLHQGLMWTHCPRVDIPRAVPKIRKDPSKAVPVVSNGL